MTSTLISKSLTVGAALLLGLSSSVPTFAHDCPKEGEQPQHKAGHMMQGGMGHMDHMKMHEKMMAKMKACMMDQMAQDTEQEPAKLRANMMGHMETCMSAMKPGGMGKKGEEQHEHGEKQGEGHDH